MKNFLPNIAGYWKFFVFFLIFSAYGTVHAGYYDVSQYSGKVIRINTYAQVLSYYQSGSKVGEFNVSTWDETHETPSGRYKILTKTDRMYSKYAYKYMPYWMEFSDGTYGIHAFPENYKWVEITSSIVGVKAAGWCVRLSKDDAKKLYGWTELGTTVIIADDPTEFASGDDEKTIRKYYDALNSKDYVKALALRIDQKYQLKELEKLNRNFTFQILGMYRSGGDFRVKFTVTDLHWKNWKSYARFRVVKWKIIRSYLISHY